MSPRQRLITPTAADESPPGAEAEPLLISSSASSTISTEDKPVFVGHSESTLSESTAASFTSDTQPADVVDIQQRDRHDIFNLIALPILLAAAVSNWDIGLWIREGTSLEESWHDTHIYELVGTITLYFAVDLFWVTHVPSCVKSPGTIVKHHVVALIYNICPIVYPEYRCFMGVILSVELNTWFLILRRVLFLRKDSPYVSSQLREFVDYAFYTSWVVIRVLGYNAILFTLLPLLALRFRLQQTVLFPSMFVGTQTVLNLMNLKWTYDLFTPIIKRNMLFSGKGINDTSNREHTL